MSARSLGAASGRRRMVAASCGIASGRNEWRELTQAVRPCRSRETGARPAPRANIDPAAARFARARPYRALEAGMRRLVRDTVSGDSTARRGGDDSYRARPRRALNSAMRASRSATASSKRALVARWSRGGFLVEPNLRRPAGRNLLLHPFAHLLVGREVFPALRVVEPQSAVFVVPHLESERFAVQAEPAVDQSDGRQRPVLAFVQAKPLQARSEPVPRGVEQPVFPDAEGGIRVRASVPGPPHGCCAR